MLDTNICIYLMRHHPPQVIERFATCDDAALPFEDSAAAGYAAVRRGGA